MNEHSFFFCHHNIIYTSEWEENVHENYEKKKSLHIDNFLMMSD